MSKYNISGDGIIIGNNNTQIFQKSGGVDKELLALIEKLATGKGERDGLVADVASVRDRNKSAEEKTSAVARIINWVKTRAGDVGKAWLAKLVLDADWSKYISDAENFFKGQ